MWLTKLGQNRFLNPTLYLTALTSIQLNAISDINFQNFHSFHFIDIYVFIFIYFHLFSFIFIYLHWEPHFHISLNSNFKFDTDIPNHFETVYRRALVNNLTSPVFFRETFQHPQAFFTIEPNPSRLMEKQFSPQDLLVEALLEAVAQYEETANSLFRENFIGGFQRLSRANFSGARRFGADSFDMRPHLACATVECGTEFSLVSEVPRKKERKERKKESKEESKKDKKEDKKEKVTTNTKETRDRGEDAEANGLKEDGEAERLAEFLGEVRVSGRDSRQLRSREKARALSLPSERGKNSEALEREKEKLEKLKNLETLEMEKLEELKVLKNLKNLKKQETVEKLQRLSKPDLPEQAKTLEPKDPMAQFGALVPLQLVQAQQSFHSALENTIQLANLQRKIVSLVAEIEKLSL